MDKLPAALLHVEPFMQCNIMEEFDVPERNRDMAERLQEYVDRGGKYLRPAIVYSTVKSYRPEQIDEFLLAARSIHYDHNWFLIHDDLEDGSFFRRGKMTMHILYGDEFAINYGDYLREIAGEAMDKGVKVWGEDVHKRLVKARREMLRTTCEGQDLEFKLRSSPLSKMTEERVFEILENKSAFYTVWTPCRYGGIISRLPDPKINALKPSLINIGMAFQIQDDVLGITKPKEDEIGKATLEEQKFGKDWAGDLEEIKRTSPLARAVNTADPGDKTFLYRMLDTDGLMRKLVKQRDGLRKEGVHRIDDRFVKIQNEIDHIKLAVIDLMKKYGVIEDCQETARKLYEDNIIPIEKILPEAEGKKELLELFHFAVFRHF